MKEWRGLDLCKSQRAMENRGTWRNLLAKSAWVPPTNLAVKGLTDGFISLQHLRSYQNMYGVVTVHIHGNFIVLPHWEIRLPAP